ncbi:MAG: hypothetical protein AMS17_18985 [Spirochaetes bacterium DG_61]|nr:MAG: hypothetical protein AMS17_18985 [Spirochaetes bacterium DG_61]
MDFEGYHSEWNLGSPGGWCYQRTIQHIGKTVWQNLNSISSIPVILDFDHPLLYPDRGFIDMLVQAHRDREGKNPGLIAVVAEEDTLDTVTENKDLARWLSEVKGITGVLMGPRELELQNGRVHHKGKPVSIIFLDFNTDVLLSLHHTYNLAPLIQAVRERRVINPRGTEPINSKSVFEVITGPHSHRFHEEIVKRTPWTRQFYPRRTTGPDGRIINDLVEWTGKNWDNLVLKPERGYSGKGVRVGGIHDTEDSIKLALDEGDFILQEKIPLDLWSEDIPVLDHEKGSVGIERCQTDFRSLLGPKRLFGFLGRYGGVPTNVGSGGGVQPLAVLRSEQSVFDAARLINDTIASMEYGSVLEVVEEQKKMALEHGLIYLLGPIKMALRPRLITESQLDSLKRYSVALWNDCLTLEEMWLEGELEEIVKIDPEELEIIRLQPWRGTPAILASDGLFNFGAQREE